MVQATHRFMVFVSHSMRPDDLKIIEAATEQMQQTGIDCYVAERDVHLGADLPNKISQAIINSDCLVAFLTHGGSASAFVQQEIAYAVALAKPVLPIVEKGVQPQGFLIGVEYLQLDVDDPAPTIQRLSAYLSAQHTEQLRLRAERAQRELASARIEKEATDQRLARVQGQATVATAIAVGAVFALAVIALILLASSPMIRGGAGASASGGPSLPSGSPLPSG